MFSAKRPGCCCLHSLHWVQHHNSYRSPHISHQKLWLWFLTPQGHPRSNLTVPIESPWLLCKKVLPGIQHRICHCFQYILNQTIVTLTFNLSRSSKVKPMGSLYNLHWVQHRNSCRSWHISRQIAWPWFLTPQGYWRQLIIWPLLSLTPYLLPFGHKTPTSPTKQPPNQKHSYNMCCNMSSIYIAAWN